jgi:hypothetical protein
MKRKEINLKSLTLEQKALLAMQEAIIDLIKERRKTGVPLCVIKNGKVVKVSAKKVRLPRLRI